jgi:hypothetical protein
MANIFEEISFSCLSRSPGCFHSKKALLNVGQSLLSQPGPSSFVVYIRSPIREPIVFSPVSAKAKVMHAIVSSLLKPLFWSKTMIYTLISLLIFFWIVGFVSHIGGDFVHTLLVLAVAVFIFNIVTGRGARV